MNKPIVSVIMPAYNTAGTLMQSINSVLSQSMRDLELIVCDDASSDATAQVLGSIEDPRFRYIRNPVNVGPGASRDRAIALAYAPWVAFIDADDIWLPERLERLLSVAITVPRRMVFDDVMTCHSSPGGLVPWRRLHGDIAFGGSGQSPYDFGLEGYLGSSRLLIKPLIPISAIRDAGVMHSSRSFGEDAEYVIRLAHAGLGFRYLPEALYLYRVRPGSLTALAGPQDMRLCIESCAALEGWPDNIRVAFHRKIISLKRNEALYALADALKGWHFFKAATLVLADPGVLLALPKRALIYLSYQFHRRRHRGASRAD
ncbi:glycosyltransferase family 2 protein [Halopseudomonas sp.]|uniref:glycosyltransferase family 2 protein n=1 Tax=Halopseudomonas sp. TaxID=2901191 RepID=UPI003001A55F